jgi:hypothetical protein
MQGVSVVQQDQDGWVFVNVQMNATTFDDAEYRARRLKRQLGISLISLVENEEIGHVAYMANFRMPPYKVANLRDYDSVRGFELMRMEAIKPGTVQTFRLALN